MERGKSDFQSWLQTAAVIGTIIATVGFFWLNVPSKDDMNRQFREVNRRITEMRNELREDIQRLEQDYKDHLAKHNETD